MVSGSCAFMSCSTSPSAITLVASAMISMTRCERERGHHLEGARVDEVADQHARLVAEDLVGGVAAAAQEEPSTTSSCSRVAVWMNSMKAAASMCASALVAAGPPGQHHQQRPQALAAAGDDVLGDLVDQRNGALQARADDGVDGVEVRLDERADLFQGHRTGTVVSGGCGILADRRALEKCAGVGGQGPLCAKCGGNWENAV